MNAVTNNDKRRCKYSALILHWTYSINCYIIFVKTRDSDQIFEKLKHYDNEI